MPDMPPLLRLDEAATLLGWSKGKLRKHLDADPPGVRIDSLWLPLRSVKAGHDGPQAGQRKVRADDVAAVVAAIRAALGQEGHDD